MEPIVEVIYRELGVQEMVLTDPLTLRRLQAERIARAVQALTSPPTDLKADNAALVEALRALEQANEDLCATRSQVTYNSMIHHDKAHDQLQALDDARSNARAILQRFPTTESRGNVCR